MEPNVVNGEIEIPYSLFKSIELESEIKTPLKYLISHASYNCNCKNSFVSINVEYQIRVFDSISNNNNNQKVGGGGSGGNLLNLVKGGSSIPTSSSSGTSLIKESIQLVSQKATILNSSIKYFKSNDSGNGSTGESIGATILTSGSYYYLHTGLSGKYIVNLELSLPYLTNKEAGMNLSIPQCSNNSISFRVPHVNANIKIFNSFIDTKSIIDWSEKHGKESNNYTITFVKLANESTLKAQWTINEDFISNKLSLDINNNNNNNNNNITPIIPKVNVKPNIIVSQNNLCSIGEGLLLLKCQFDYKIIAGTISLFNIEIQDNINIINIDGVAIKRWEVLDLERPTSHKHNRVIQIQLDYGFETHYSLLVNAEYSMKDTSGELNIPSMICKGDEISRQRGFLGVEARTNVEISDIGNQGLNVVDVRELPTELSTMANHPILLSYKFLEPDFQLSLRVKRNMDCAVLVSICEQAHFISTVSYSGKIIHQIIMHIKNTQQQFLRIQVPFEYEIYSTMLDSEPVKPSICDPHLLIPILKPGIFDQNTPMKIEIVLLQKSIHKFDHKTKKGKFNFTIPKIDLPLRSAYSTVYLPPGTEASNFTGNLKNVSYFSDTPPSASQPSKSTIVAPQRARGWGNRNDSVSNFEEIKVQKNKLSSTRYAGKSSINSNGRRMGVVPVFVEIPQTTKFYYFEQILLSGDKDLNFSFDYKSKDVKVRR